MLGRKKPSKKIYIFSKIKRKKLKLTKFKKAYKNSLKKSSLTLKKKIRENKIKTQTNILVKKKKNVFLWKTLLSYVKKLRSMARPQKHRDFFNNVKQTTKYWIIVLNCLNINLKLEQNYKQNVEFCFWRYSYNGKTI